MIKTLILTMVALGSFAAEVPASGPTFASLSAEEKRTLLLKNEWNGQAYKPTKDLVRVLTDDSVPLDVRFYLAIRLIDDGGLTNQEALGVGGFVHNLLVERSTGDAASLMVHFWKMVPTNISDAEIFQSMTKAGWKVSEDAYYSFIYQKRRVASPHPVAEVLLPRLQIAPGTNF